MDEWQEVSSSTTRVTPLALSVAALALFAPAAVPRLSALVEWVAGGDPPTVPGLLRSHAEAWIVWVAEWGALLVAISAFVCAVALVWRASRSGEGVALVTARSERGASTTKRQPPDSATFGALFERATADLRDAGVPVVVVLEGFDALSPEEAWDAWGVLGTFVRPSSGVWALVPSTAGTAGEGVARTCDLTVGVPPRAPAASALALERTLRAAFGEHKEIGLVKELFGIVRGYPGATDHDVGSFVEALVALRHLWVPNDDLGLQAVVTLVGNPIAVRPPLRAAIGRVLGDTGWATRAVALYHYVGGEVASQMVFGADLDEAVRSGDREAVRETWESRPDGEATAALRAVTSALTEVQNAGAMDRVCWAAAGFPTDSRTAPARHAVVDGALDFDRWSSVWEVDHAGRGVGAVVGTALALDRPADAREVLSALVSSGVPSRRPDVVARAVSALAESRVSSLDRAFPDGADLGLSALDYLDLVVSSERPPLGALRLVRPPPGVDAVACREVIGRLSPLDVGRVFSPDGAGRWDWPWRTLHPCLASNASYGSVSEAAFGLAGLGVAWVRGADARGRSLPIEDATLDQRLGEDASRPSALLYILLTGRPTRGIGFFDARSSSRDHVRVAQEAKRFDVVDALAHPDASLAARLVVAAAGNHTPK